QRDILRAPLIIRAAVACMEKTLCEKRYRYFLKLWEETDLETQAEECAYYQKQSYAEKKRIAELERERQVAFEDLAGLPWVGEFYSEVARGDTPQTSDEPVVPPPNVQDVPF
ncbi:MAG: hypothetical protein AAF959_07295, partial [Cyanobacteria bacterium P01_D01_bin.56]